MMAPPHWLQTQNIQKIFALLAQNGGEGRIVGGAVRDHLLGTVIGDVDFCSTHTPDQLIEIAKQNDIRYIETGIKFGTVTLILDGRPYEVTSLRADVETNGRHAKVVYGGDFSQDALRRDFSFNALYMAADGTIFDPLGTGIDDLAAKKIRFIGNAAARIEEDYLRILRYFRFIARFGFDYDLDDYKQITKLVVGLKQLSAERLLMEFRGIYQAKFLIHSLKLMAECKIFVQIFNIAVEYGGLEYFEKHQVNHENIWLIKFKLSLPKASAKTLKFQQLQIYPSSHLLKF